MPKKLAIAQERNVPCTQCPLRALRIFRDFTPEELAFINGFKTAELTAKAGSTLLLEGHNSAHLYTLLSGWAFRYKTLDDGRRQVLNFLLPGDFIGLQSSTFNEMQHSVEALTDVALCVFPRDGLWTLYASHPGLGFDITWLASREEMIVDNHLLSVGRRTALEKVAYLFLHLYRRARELRLAENGAVKLPLTQQHVADLLGMSLVHTNKTLKRLFERKLVRWRDRTLTILDEKGLAELCGYELEGAAPRPLI
ncbi:MAG: Crp/Fnr family transcriptional regulator [Parvibaculaceae bacterium]